MAFVKLQRSSATMELMTSDPAAFQVLTVIALRADRDTGEAMIGDWKKMGATSRGAYRNALNRLLQASYITIKTTNKGSIAKLIDTRVYDINQVEASHQESHQSSQQAPKKQATKQATNKKLQEVFIQEVTRRGAQEALVRDWLKDTRGAKKNTPRALDAQLKNLDYLISVGYQAQRVFEVLTEKNWQGIKTGKNPNDQYFLDELKEHFDERERITDTSWAGGNQPGICNPAPDLSRIHASDDRGGGSSGEAVVVAGVVEFVG